MNITKERAQSILRTLPIGYYLKRNIDVELSETASTSYIDLENERITIAMNNFYKAHKSAVSNEQLEETVRAILYHELSHALLTPKCLDVTDIINIFEDERIETLLKNFYINVNFKQNIGKIVNVDALSDMVPRELFFKIVRFRKGPQHFVDRVSYLIKRYMHINAETTEVSDYCWEINNFYLDVKQYSEQLKREYESGLKNDKDETKDETQVEETQTESNENDNKSNEDKTEDEAKDEELTTIETQTESNENEESNEDKTEDEESITIETQTESAEIDDNESDEDEAKDEASTTVETNSEGTTETDENELSEEELDKLTNELISKLNKRMDNSETNQYVKELTPIIKQARTQQSNTASAINAYSGVFNPRSVVNNDYKYFVQKNRAGHLKQFSKIRLNLYIDRSGSFRDSQDTVNAFLNALAKLEKEITDFEFNLVTIGSGEIVHDKNDRQIECYDGNALTTEIFKIMKRLTCTDCTLYNIVLFDGDAFSHDVPYAIRMMSSRSNFKVFNSPNTYIISDRSNWWVINQYAPLAKTTFTRNYAKDFKQQILNILQNIFR